MKFTYNLQGDIVEGTAEKMQTYIDGLQIQPQDELQIIINSQGGSVIEGLALFDYISALSSRFSVSALICGICASAATYAPCACDKVEMTRNSSYMTHEPQAGLYGSVDEIRRDLEYFDSLRARVIAIYGARTGMTAEQVENTLIRTTAYLTAQEALNLGLVDIVDGLTRETEPETTPETPEFDPQEAAERADTAEAGTDSGMTPQGVFGGITNRIFSFAGLAGVLTENKAALLRAETEKEKKELESRICSLEAENKAKQNELDGYKEQLALKAEKLAAQETNFENKVAVEVANRIAALAMPVEDLPAVQQVEPLNLAKLAKEKGLEAALNFLAQ